MPAHRFYAPGRPLELPVSDSEVAEVRDHVPDGLGTAAAREGYCDAEADGVGRGGRGSIWIESTTDCSSVLSASELPG